MRILAKRTPLARAPLRRVGRLARLFAGALALAALAALLALAACRRQAGPTWPADGSLTVAIEQAPAFLDPRVSTSQAAERVFDVLLSGLVARDPAGGLVPDLARSWEILDGGLRYRFHLRPGLTFHDGRPLSAADVAWTFGSILDGTVVTPKRAAFAELARVGVVDPLTVDFALSAPNGSFLVELTSSLGIVPAGTTPEEMNARPVGSGPFRLVGRAPEKLVFAPFDGYWRGRPRLSRLVFREVPDPTVRVLELLKGTVQLVVNDLPPDVVPRFRSDPAYRVVAAPGSGYAYLGLNLRDPALSDLRVRRALALSIDRPRLVSALWHGMGEVTETLLPPGQWARDDELAPLPHDPAAARRLLDEAGYPDPDGEAGPLPRLTLTYKTSTDEGALLQAQAIQAMAREAGIALAIRSYEFATFFSDIQRGDFQVFSLVRTGVSDPNIYRLVLHSAAEPPAGQNRGHYANPRFDLLIDRAVRLTDPAARRPLYREAQEIVAHDLPYVSLYNKATVAVMAAGLTGYQSYPGGELTSLRDVAWGP